MPCSLTLLAEGGDVPKEGGEDTPGDGEDTPGDGDVTMQQQLRSAEQRGLLKCPSSCSSCSSSPRGAPSPVVLHLPSLPLHVVVPGDAPWRRRRGGDLRRGVPSLPGDQQDKNPVTPSPPHLKESTTLQETSTPCGGASPPKAPYTTGGAA